MPSSFDSHGSRLPSEDERAVLAQRGFALVRSWLPKAVSAELKRELRAGRRDALEDLPDARASLAAWFGGALRDAECELGAVVAGDPTVGTWRQEYGCVVRAGELRPLRLAALIGLGASSAQRLELEIRPGSHRAGRLAHRVRAGVSSVLPDRAPAQTQWAESGDYPTLGFELGPGDALFLQANLLHRLLPAPGPNPREFAVARFDVDA